MAAASSSSSSYIIRGRIVILYIFCLHFCYYYSSVSSAVPPVICDSNALTKLGLDPQKLKFCDKSVQYQVRAADLVNRMSLEEKIAQLGDQSPGVERLNIPPYNWRSEALHGVSDFGVGTHFNDQVSAATSFPSVILTAATFNEQLWEQIGVAVSDEARAMHNEGLAGLTFWSPNVNVARDPRWGRIDETAGEDPFLVARYAVNYVRGLQDVDRHTNVTNRSTRSLKVAACCKYFTGYDLENANGKPRYQYDAQVSERDLLETFNYPFEMCVKEGDAACIMCSYNKVNGVPTCTDPKLLNQTIRESWGFHGYIVTPCDWDLATVIGQKFLNDTPADAISQAYKAGVDLDCRGGYTPKYIGEAINQGKLTEATINQALVNLYVVLMRLGVFDGSHGDYSGLGKADVCKVEHSALSLDAARQGIVLLENTRGILPLRLSLNGTNKPTIAVVGPHANATTAMTGNYASKSGKACRYLSPLDYISRFANVKYAPGCSDLKCESDQGIPEAIKAMEGTEATIVFVGLDQSFEHEGLDRETLYLPQNQQKLVMSILETRTDSCEIVVILSAGGIDISEWNWRVCAVVWAGYPGADGGAALADLLFGRDDPSGRLPITWYKEDYIKSIPKTSMQLRPNPNLGYPGRTYKFYNGDDIVYPFGHGMSYTRFNITISSAPRLVSVERPELPKCRKIVVINGTTPDDHCPTIPVRESKCNEMVKIGVNVTNIGNRMGAYTILLYSVPPSNIGGGSLPIKRLIGFQRSSKINPDNSYPFEFNLNVCKSFSYISDDGSELLPAGDHLVGVGNVYAAADWSASATLSISFQGGRQTRMGN